MKCPSCGRDNPDGTGVCGGCGQPLVSVRACPRCGHANPQTNRSCENCGLSLTEPTPGLTRNSVPTSFAGGRYRIIRLLGEGGMKKVYLAHDTRLDRDVAVAFIKGDGLEDENRSRFEREARVMGHLGQHPNIITVYDLGEEEGQLYMVTELVSGDSVESLMGKSLDRRLAVEQSLDIAKAVCRALEVVHSRGIVHRDLKPGNVYVSSDGTIKIGDFGLAFGIDLSRLTRSGMTLGTVSYMTPEQAMGLQPTPQADLYSLGAMLYEMLTGRPPFVGDTIVSVISQHINTTPVSPAWHRREVPPALDSLVIQLLEKDPGRRPTSATAVLKALELIGGLQGRLEPPTDIAPADNPIYRRVFVGRAAELKRLQSAFDQAMSGRGGLMMVTGEAGIGKTALCEQLATYVTLRGGRTLVGHCYEGGSSSLPYLPFVEAMRDYALGRSAEDLRVELGRGAASVARIVPEIKERLRVRARPQKHPEEERYRLLQAVSSFLTNVAAAQPLLVVLEDLHNADTGTLDMLTHVARNLAGARVLIVGTYRDVGVDRNSPLSEALFEVSRVSAYDRVALRGLSVDEARRMLESIAGEGAPPRLPEAVCRQTEGNPLFVQEVIRFLHEQGLLTRKEGRWHPTVDVPLEMHIPEGLRGVIGKRLSLLTEDCKRLLSVASVIGSEFGLETLRELAEISEDSFLDALKEAVRLSVLEEQPHVGLVRYRFTHAFFRQTLYEEMIAPQRRKLHQRVARFLEAFHSKRLEEHAAELAGHFSLSTDPSDLAKAVQYGEMAARKAMDVYASGEAVRLLERALAVQEALDPADSSKRCDLLLALGDALMNEGEPRRVLDEVAPNAWALAEAPSDTARSSSACHLAMLALFYFGVGPAWTTPEAALWAERAKQAARPNTVASAQADTATGIVKCATGHQEEGVPFLVRAMKTAKSLGDNDAHWWAAAMFLTYASGFEHNQETLDAAQELAEGSRSGVSTAVLVWALVMVAHTFLDHGRRQEAETVWHRAKHLIDLNGQARYQVFSMAGEAFFATLDGHLERAVEMTDRIREYGRENGFSALAEVQAFNIGMRALLHLGMAKKALECFAAMSLDAKALCLAHLGLVAEATSLLEELTAPGHSQFAESRNEAPAYGDVVLLETAVLLRNRRAADALLRRLDKRRSRTTGIFHATCIDRHLATAASLLGRHDEALAYCRRALDVCNDMRFRPEAALVRLQMADLILEHYPHEAQQARGHLEFAISQFRDMNMLPSLEQALRHRQTP